MNHGPACDPKPLSVLQSDAFAKPRSNLTPGRTTMPATSENGTSQRQAIRRVLALQANRSGALTIRSGRVRNNSAKITNDRLGMLTAWPRAWPCGTGSTRRQCEWKGFAIHRLLMWIQYRKHPSSACTMTVGSISVAVIWLVCGDCSRNAREKLTTVRLRGIKQPLYVLKLRWAWIVPRYQKSGSEKQSNNHARL